MKTLLFAVLASNKLAVTFVDAVGETRTFDVPPTIEAVDLKSALERSLEVEEIKGFQIFGVPAEPTADVDGDGDAAAEPAKEHPHARGNQIEVLHLDGINMFLNEPAEELVVARDALREELEALIAPL